MDAKVHLHPLDRPADSNNYENLSEELLDRVKEDEYLEMVQKLKTNLDDKTSECEILKIQLDQKHMDIESLRQEINECKLTMFENNEDSRKTREEVTKSKKLEEDYVTLMDDFLKLNEQSEKYRRTMFDNYLAKSNAINNLECLVSSGAIRDQLDECRTNLENRLADLNLTTAKIRHLEEENGVKEKCITELKRSLDDAKVTHKHEITVLEEYIQCLKNTISSYERTLADYIEPKAEPSPSGGQQ